MVDDARIADILGRWKECREAGHAEEADQLIRDHPELAGALDEHLAAERLLEHDLSPAPTRIGDFEVLRELGRGGMGVVYEAEQISMRRKVALKVLPVTITGTPNAVRRFQREARAAGKLHHTNIVPIHAMGRESGHWYYAMELVAGRPLSDVIAQLRRAARPTEEELARVAQGEVPASSSRVDELDTDTGDRSYFMRVAETFAAVADGLQLAHVEGVIHRDIKPSNLLLDVDGTLKIVDFGLAHVDDAGGPAMTVTGDLLGTPVYMSPEQVMVKRKPIDHRTDVYSLGATLYELLTFQPPFSGDSLHDVCAQILTKEPMSPRRRSPRIPRDLETIVLKAMEKDRDRRYQSADLFARDLRRFAEGKTIHARRIGFPGRAWRVVKRNRVRSTLVAAVLLGAIGASWFAWQWKEEQKARRELQYRELLSSTISLGMRERWDGSALGFRTGIYRFDEAIALAPERPEAYWLRGMMERRIEDLDSARARGLPEGTWRRMRALVLRGTGHPREAVAEHRLAGPAESPLAICYEVPWLLAMEPDYARAVRMLSRAAAAATPRSVVHDLILGRRAGYREKMGDFAGALEDRIQRNRTGIADRIARASLWRKLGKTGIAETRFEELLAETRERGDVSSWVLLCGALGHFTPGDWSLRACEEAVRAQPHSAVLRSHLAHAVFNSFARGHDPETFDRCERLCREVLELDERRVEAHWIRGRLLKEAFRNDEAIEAFERAPGLCALPERRVEYWRALILVGRSAEVLGEVDSMLKRHPYRWKLHAVRARALQRERSAAAALKAWNRTIALNPQSREAYSCKGLLLTQLGEPQKGIESCRRALDLDPSAPGAYLALAIVLERIGKHEEAILECDKGVKLCPDHPGLLGQKMRLLARLGRAKDVLKASDAVLAVNPKSAAAYALQGDAFSQLGRLRDAESAYVQSLELARDQHRVLVNLSGVLLRLYAGNRAQVQKARKLLERARALNGKSVECLVTLSFCYARLDLLDDALEACSAALDVDSKCPEALVNRCSYLHQLDRPADTVTACEAALAVIPNNRNVYAWKGIALQRLDRLDDAGFAFERAVELGHTGIRASGLAAIAWLRATSPDPDIRDTGRALRFAQLAVNRAEADPQSQRCLGVALYRAGHWRKALNALAEAVKLNKNEGACEAYFIAMSLAQLDMKTRARTWYEKGVVLHGDQSSDKELKRFRAEAEQVLGIERH